MNTLLQNETKVQSVVELLDKFYKKEYSVFVSELVVVVGKEHADTICHLIETKDYSLLEHYDPSAFEMIWSAAPKSWKMILATVSLWSLRLTSQMLSTRSLATRTFWLRSGLLV